MQLYRRVPILELDYRSSIHSLSCIYDSDVRIDAPDFYESSFWKDSDPESGLGGWGDPNADYSVPDGGFRNLHVSYPSPHIIRRNFTLQPFDTQSPLMTDLLKIGNSSFSASVIDALLETSVGDINGFQVVLAAPEVRSRT